MVVGCLVHRGSSYELYEYRMNVRIRRELWCTAKDHGRSGHGQDRLRSASQRAFCRNYGAARRCSERFSTLPKLIRYRRIGRITGATVADNRVRRSRFRTGGISVCQSRRWWIGSTKSV